MLSRIFAFCIFLIVTYVLAVFLLPEIADQYGNPEINAKIRHIKDDSLMIASGSETPDSLYQSLRKGTEPYINDATNAVTTATTTVTQKLQQAEQVASGVQSTYNSLQTTTNTIKNLATFATGTSN